MKSWYDKYTNDVITTKLIFTMESGTIEKWHKKKGGIV